MGRFWAGGRKEGRKEIQGLGAESKQMVLTPLKDQTQPTRPSNGSQPVTVAEGSLPAHSGPGKDPGQFRLSHDTSLASNFVKGVAEASTHITVFLEAFLALAQACSLHW